MARAWPSVEAAARALKAGKAERALGLYRRALSIDPRNIYAASGAADALFILKRYPEAETAYRNALALNPKEPKDPGLGMRLLRSLGEIAIIRGNTRAAEAIWRQVLAAPAGVRVADDRFTANYKLAQIAVAANQAASSFRYFEAATKAQPRNAKVWAEYGEALSYTERGPRARKILNKALGLNPNSIPTRLALANLLTWTTDYKNSIVQFREVLKRQSTAKATDRGNTPWSAPENKAARKAALDAALLGLADALTYARKPKDAIPVYQRALASNPASPEARFGLGRALVFTSRFEDAIAPLRQASRQQPENLEALHLLAIAQAGRDGSPSARASAALVTYRALLARQTLPEQQAATLAAIGDLQNGENDVAGARRSYENSLRLDPRNIEVSNSLAQILLSNRELDRARSVIESALAVYASNVRAGASAPRTGADAREALDAREAMDASNLRTRILQLVLENASGNRERAIALARPLERASAPNAGDALQLAGALRQAGNPAAANRIIVALGTNLPKDRAQALNIVNAVRDSGSYDFAIKLYQKLIDAQPKDVRARLEMAEVLTWSRQYPAARAQLEAALRIQPDNQEAQVKRAVVLVRELSPQALEQNPQAADVARTELARLLVREPDNASVRIASAELQTLLKSFSGAAADYRAVLEADADNLRARHGLARSLYYSRQTEAAITEYRELMRRAPESNQVKLELAQLYLDINRLPEAETLFNEVAADQRTILPPLVDGRPVLRSNAALSSALPFLGGRASQAQVLGGQILGTASRVVGRYVPVAGKPRRYSVERVQIAQATTSNVAASAGSGATGSVGSAVARTAASGVGTGASTAGSGSGSLLPGPEYGPSERVLALRGLGEVQRRQNHLDEAIRLFREALDLAKAEGEGDLPSQLGLAQALRDKKDYTGALAQIESVLTVDVGNLPARALRAQIFTLTGRSPEAQAELDRIVTSLENPIIAGDPPRLEDFEVIAGALVGLQSYDTALRVIAIGRQRFPEERALQVANAEALAFARRFPAALEAYDKLLTTDARSPELLLGRARVFNYSDALPEAQAAYLDLLKEQPTNHTATVELGSVLSRRGNFAEAARLYRVAIAQDASDLQPQLELGRVLRYGRQFDESDRVLSAILNIEPLTEPLKVDALTERGVLRGQRGDYDLALTDLDEALALSPNNLSAIFAIAEVQGYVGKYDKSIANYRTALGKQPDNLKGRTGLGVVLGYAGQTDEALRELDTVLQTAPGNVDAQVAKASVLARARRLDESVALYNTILEANPNNLRAQEGLAEALVIGGKYLEGVRVYDALITRRQDEAGLPRAQDTLGYRIRRAQALSYARSFPEAEAGLREVLASAPQNLEARVSLAEVLTNSGSAKARPEAIAIFRSVVRERPANIPARIGLGRALSYEGDNSEAQSILSSVVKEAPQNREALLALAESQRFSGRFPQAQATYNSVLALDPTNAVALAGLGNLRGQLGSSVTLAGQSYTDSNGVRVNSVLFGPTFDTRLGRIGVTLGEGRFRDDNIRLKRQSLNLLLARQIGPLAARLVLTRLKYGGNAPDKNLYDFSLGRNGGQTQRLRYFLGASRLDVFESAGAVLRGITARQIRAGVDLPLARQLDLELRASHYNYSDSNRRDTLGASLFYRLKPGVPSLRVGVGYVRDDSDFFSPLYYTPQNFNVPSILADYVVDTGRVRYGLFAQHPLNNSSGLLGRNRPADTLFGNIDYDVSDTLQAFANGGIVRSPNFHSRDINAGIRLGF